MRIPHLLLALPVVAALMACGLLGSAGKGLSMRYTNLKEDPQLYDALARAAEQQGWKHKRGQSENDWDLEVFPAEGQVIQFSEHIQDGTIGFVCEGGELDDMDACRAAANKLFSAGWGKTFEAGDLKAP